VTHDAKKQKHESEVFFEFLSRSGIDVSKESVSSGDHLKGEPDILCKTQDGECLAYELSSITDENLIKVQMRHKPWNGEYVRTSDPTDAIVSEKLAKEYSVSCPVHLLIYRNYVGTPDSMVLAQVKETCSRKQHKFASIWYMSKDVHQIVWERGVSL
jgi:hypothetical protein